MKLKRFAWQAAVVCGCALLCPGVTTRLLEAAVYVNDLVAECGQFFHRDQEDTAQQVAIRQEVRKEAGRTKPGTLPLDVNLPPSARVVSDTHRFDRAGRGASQMVDVHEVVAQTKESPIKIFSYYYGRLDGMSSRQGSGSAHAYRNEELPLIEALPDGGTKIILTRKTPAPSSASLAASAVAGIAHHL